MELSKKELKQLHYLLKGSVVNTWIVEGLHSEDFTRKNGRDSRQKYFVKCKTCGYETTRYRSSIVNYNSKGCTMCSGHGHWEPISVGDVSGRLTVVSDKPMVEDKNKPPYQQRYLCKCSCGNKVNVAKQSIVLQHTQSCGCLQMERAIEASSIPNKIKKIDENTYEILFTGKNYGLLVDTNVVEMLRQCHWYEKHNGYAISTNKDRFGKAFYAHRLIMDCPKSAFVDHIDKNKLNNRKDNLRLCTKITNAQNTKARSNTLSGVTGVRPNSRCSTWMANICVNKKTKYLGSFRTKREATLARYVAEKKYFKEFAPDWKLKYANNQEILDLIPWLEKEYEKIKDCA